MANFVLQLRELKRQGLTQQDIASRMGRSVKSVQSKWSRIADEGEKRKHVRFSEAEGKLVGLSGFVYCMYSFLLCPLSSCCAWL